jgi:hypothetical protein
MERPRRGAEPCCPFLDRDDSRCAHRLTLSHLDEAFAYCLHHYRRCPLYHQLMREAKRERAEPAQPQPARPPVPLRRERSGERTESVPLAVAVR